MNEITKDELLKRLENLENKFAASKAEISYLKYQLTVIIENENTSKALNDSLLVQEDSNKFSSEPSQTEATVQPSSSTLKEENQNPKTEKEKIYKQKLDNPPQNFEFNKSKASSDFLYNKKNKDINLEEYLGKNLLNKVGILILIIGVIIGVKYSIDNNLISPSTRIILGYVLGLGLLFTSSKLKEKYLNFSAVVLSGAMFTFYFVSYSAYSLYNLIPYILSFLLMLSVTIFAIISAIKYKREIIAIIGMIGAYAIPFLISNSSGNLNILISYSTIITFASLFVAIKNNWEITKLAGFLFIWLLLFTVFDSLHKATKISCSLILYAVYSFVIIRELIGESKSKYPTIVMLIFIINTFVSFLGIIKFFYSIQILEFGKQIGVISLCFACINFYILNYLSKHSTQVSYFRDIVLGQILTFITLSILFIIEDNWLCIALIAEATILSWINSKNNSKILNIAKYALVIISLSLILFYLNNHYYSSKVDVQGLHVSKFLPIFNKYFLTNLLYIACLFLIRKFDNTHVDNVDTKKVSYGKLLINSLLVIFCYLLFFLEIDSYFNLSLMNANGKDIEAAINVKNTVNLIYMSLFILVSSIINNRFYKNIIISKFMYLLCLSLIPIVLIFKLTTFWYAMNWFKFNLTTQNYSFIELIGLKYILLFALLTTAILIIRTFVKPSDNENFFFSKNLLTYWTLCILVYVLSNELLYASYFFDYNDAYKTGLSVLWSILAIGLLSIGIKNKNKEYRYFSIFLSLILVLKLIIFDTSNFTTLQKTFVYLVIGIVLLFLSFLYNKFKDKIFNEEN